MVASTRVVRREVRRREARLRVGLGSQITELRQEAGVSQAALSRAAGLDQSYVSKIERGTVAASTETLLAISIALGADLGVRLFPGAGPRIRDHLQAAMVEALLRELHPTWLATPELPVPLARGVIDVALRRADVDGVACEAHSQLRSVDLVLRRVREKSLALSQVIGFGSATSSLLLVRSTAANRDIVRVHTATFRAAFPASSREALAALRSDVIQWQGSALLWASVEGGRAHLLEGPARLLGVGR